MSPLHRVSHFVRSATAFAVGLLTLAALVQPQRSAHANNYTLTTCTTSELISVYSTAISTSVDDTITLRSGCAYIFTGGTGRAVADLPAASSAGKLTIYGNGASIGSSITVSPNLGFLSAQANSWLEIYDLKLENFDSDVGAGILTQGTLKVYRSAFWYNIATQLGGAIALGPSATLEVYDTQFTENRSLDGGAIGTVSGSTGIVRRSAFNGNRVTRYGGALSLASNTFQLSSNLFWNNIANDSGGAIYASAGNFDMRNLTLYNNVCDNDQNNVGDGGGLFVSGATVILHNTAVGANADSSQASNIHRDVSGPVSSSSKNNLVSNGTGLSGITNGVNGNQIGTLPPININLGVPYNRNGLGTIVLQYLAPAANSPLVNNGSTSEVVDVRDLSGNLRIGNVTVDIGAVEFKRPDSPVVINPANQGWLFRYTNSAGPVEFSFLYGQGLSDYQPIVGDWNGDDIDTQGVYTRFNASNIGVFALSNMFNSFDSSTLPSFAYTDASPNWLPVAGDWNCDGSDAVGVYNISTGIWVLTNTNASVAPSYPAFAFGGGAGIVPVAGDWDGDGCDSIGIYNYNNGGFVLSNGIGAVVAVSYNFVYGAAGYAPVVGDWNGDGIDTPGLYNPSTGQWLLRNTNDNGSANVAFVYGAGSGLIGRVGQWRNVTPGNGTGPIRESAVTPIVPAVTPDAPQIAPTFAP